MTSNIDKIISEAISRKACGKVREIRSMGNAISVLLSAQGREFAIRTGYPTASVFRDNRDALSGVPGVYVDAGHIHASGHDTVAVGDTVVTVEAGNPDGLYHIISMHGAHVILDASDYAVVTLTVIDGTFEIVNDGTAAITIERKDE